MQKTGADAGVLHTPELQERMEKGLEPFGLAKSATVRISGSDVYFGPEVYEQLKQDPKGMRAVLNAAMAQPGVAGVFRADQLQNRPAGKDPVLNSFANSYFAGRSGDLLIVPKSYWLIDSTAKGKARSYGTGHGTPYNYDQHVPILLMGRGIRPGVYDADANPADIAPTLASLCGITLVSRDGRVLAEALNKAGAPTGSGVPPTANLHDHGN
jgi:hypothetical protein